MDFTWTDEQLAFRKSVVSFAQKDLHHDCVEADRQGEFSRQLWNKCAEFGILGLPIPVEYRGGDAGSPQKNPDADLLTAVLGMEALGYGCGNNGLTFGLNAQMWMVQLSIVHYGTEDQKRRYLPGLCSGQILGANGMTEPDAGSDLFAIKTQAKKCNGGYVLNGTKRFITCGPIADLLLVFATVDPNLGKWGLTAFLVERDSPGYITGPTMDKMGLRTVPFGEITFEDCFVPEHNRLGPEGAGVSISNHSLEYERSCILASQLGAMERQLDQAVQYAKTRKQFGQSIGKFQSVSNRIADMKLRLEVARLLLYKAVWLKSKGESAMMDAVLSKLYLSEAFAQSSLDAIRIHGGIGYLTETEVERDLRDSVGAVIYAGTSDLQRNIITRLLGL